MKSTEKKQIARSLFLNSDITRKVIAQQAKITEQTLRRWIEQGKWEQTKDAKTVTRAILLQDSYAQLKALNIAINQSGGVPNKEQSDAKAVLRKEIEALKDTPIHVYVEVFEEFIGYISSVAPTKLQELSAFMQSFLETKHS